MNAIGSALSMTAGLVATGDQHTFYTQRLCLVHRSSIIWQLYLVLLVFCMQSRTRTLLTVVFCDHSKISQKIRRRVKKGHVVQWYSTHALRDQRQFDSTQIVDFWKRKARL